MLDTSEENQEFIWWEQVLDTIIKWTLGQTKVRPLNIIKEPFCQFFSLPHCQREVVVRVVPVETQDSFCYVVVTRYGRVGLYDWSLELLDQYKVKLGAKGWETRCHTTWVTDACYLADATMLLIAASSRSLHFYSATGLVHVPIYHISGMPNTPTCLHYTVGVTTEDPSILLIGNDHGSITTMKFLQPQYALFKRTSTDRMDTYFWKELELQKDWVAISTDQGIHKSEVIKVEYMNDNNSVISCSNDPDTTLIIRHTVGRRKPYIFKMGRGVKCFHLDRTLKLLVTGGKDSIIRMWNPVITKKPIASLFGHKTYIVDVRILKHLRVILSMSKDAVLKVWDIEDQSCLQSMPRLFPVYDPLSRRAEFGIQTFYPGPICCDPPTTSKQDKPSLQNKQQTTHPASLLSTSSTTQQKRASIYRNEGEWNRMELLAVCCDYIILLQLSERELKEEDGRVGEALPPPLREQEPAMPSPWLTVDSAQQSSLIVDYPSQISSSSEATSPLPLAILETLQKSFGDDMTYHFKPLTSANHNLNAARARQYTTQKQVKAMIEQCAPHLVLKLIPLEEIRFTQPLPTCSRMRNTDLSNPDKLLKARLKRDSTSTVASKTSNTSTSSTIQSTKKNVS